MASTHPSAGMRDDVLVVVGRGEAAGCVEDLRDAPELDRLEARRPEEAPRPAPRLEGIPSRFASSNSSWPCAVRRTGISSKLSSETMVTSAAPPRTAARAESSASTSRASDSAPRAAPSAATSSSRPTRSAVRAASKATNPPPITTTRRPRSMR